MDTLTSTGSGMIPPQASPNPKRRRPWPLIALATVLILLAGFGAFTGSFLSNYQPLSGDGLMSGVGPRYARDLGNFTSPHGEDFDEYLVSYPGAGHHFRYGFTLQNTGPIGVTIEEVRPLYAEPGLATPLIFTGARIGPIEGSHPIQITGGDPFRTFPLGSNQFMYVELENRFSNCTRTAGAFTEFSGIDVTFRVFGVTRHTEVYPGYTLRMNGVGSCPIHS